MADVRKHGFKTVEKSYEEIDEEIRRHRRKVFFRTIEVIVVAVIVVAAIELIYALRSFSSYEVVSSVDRSSSSAVNFREYNGYVLEYSNDGISCMTRERELQWNQSYEFSKPEIAVCKKYLAVYDEGGTQVYILGESGYESRIETPLPIQKVCVAQQGTIAVLMRSGAESQVKLFDKKGEELANGKFYAEKGGFPIDIALSYDATKLAVDMIDVSAGSVSTTITFYNFGTVGQSEIDNNVGTYQYDGLVIPEIDYVSETRMLAMGTGKLLVFEGAQKPEPVTELAIENEVVSYFHNDKYVGIVYDNKELENTWHIQVMDMKGKTVMENETTLDYDRIEFLSNNEICVTNDMECEIFTIHSIKKFAYTFEKELYKIVAGGSGQNYTFIFKETTDEVRLK